MKQYLNNTINVYEPIVDNNKPFCVLGVLKNTRGLEIKKELLEWLEPKYNVYIVEQDEPGKLFEYPAIKYMQDLMNRLKIDYCLYLHTKGAHNNNHFADCVRYFWKTEFDNNSGWYINKIKNTTTPLVVCPFTGKCKTTWLNGFFINRSALNSIHLVITTNRFVYETLFKDKNNGVTVVGRIANDIESPPNNKRREEIKQYIRDMYPLNSTKKNKKVVYTCITGGYDDLLKPVITDDFDYVCFTDNLNIDGKGVWKILPLPEETNGLSQVKKQRFVKINAHKVLPQYDLSIWVDANIEIKSNLNDFLKNYQQGNLHLYIPQHPIRKCLYKEGQACIKIKKETSENVDRQLNGYRREGFPINYGLPQSNIILRLHNEADCIRLMETWWDELKTKSHRDQLSFSYAAWKNKDVKFSYINKYIYKSKWFNWKVRHKKKINTDNKTNSSIQEALSVVKKDAEIKPVKQKTTTIPRVMVKTKKPLSLYDSQAKINKLLRNILK